MAEKDIAEKTLEALWKYYTEVVKMMQWDFTFEHRLELEREEEREETAKRLLRRGKLTCEEIAEDTGLSIERVEALEKEKKPGLQFV